MRAEPHPAVLAWMAVQPRTLLYTTHINQAEILYGITALPEGRRRTALAATAMAMFAEDFLAVFCRSMQEQRRATLGSCSHVSRPAIRSRNLTR